MIHPQYIVSIINPCDYNLNIGIKSDGNGSQSGARDGGDLKLGSS